MKIGVLGHGTVGSGVAQIIDTLKDVEVKTILVKDDSEVSEARMTSHFEDILNDPEIAVVVECIGGLEPAHTYVAEALKHGKHAVTSNKKMLANFAEELFALAEENGVSLRYEASVGGGIPWMHQIERISRIDPIDSFDGIFNGTTNYILSSMTQKNVEFAEVLKEAQSLGYAEADPSDDIDGMDVRYKLAISSAAAFSALVDPEEIMTFGIRYISAGDIAWAKENDRVCKLVGTGTRSGNTVSLFVRPVFVKKDNVLANISKNDNAISCDSASLGRLTLVGQGAGSLPTGNAVVQDVLDLKNGEVYETHAKKESVSYLDKHGTFYVRSRMVSHLPENYIAHKISTDVIVTRHISYMDLKVIRSCLDEETFIAEVEE